jgi:hypothetical protein
VVVDDVTFRSRIFSDLDLGNRVQIVILVHDATQPEGRA